MINFFNKYKSLAYFSKLSHSHQLYYQSNTNQRKQFLNNKHNQNILIKGHCTKDHSYNFSKRSEQIHFSNWKIPTRTQVTLSSIGIGTYKGQINEQNDIQMFNAIIDSVLTNGINVIDTCSSFRYSKSEKIVKQAISYLIQHKKYLREQLFVITKQGYLIEDADLMITQNQIMKKLIDQKLIQENDIVNGHCAHPNYLEYLLNRSISNLGLQTIDLLMLNNFSQSQLPFIKKDEFQYRLQKAFQFYEEKIAQKKIKSYGMTSWSSFRLPKESNLYLSLQNVVKLAEKIGGKDHGFKFIEIPINIMMPQSFGETQQVWSNPQNSKQQLLSILSVAFRQKINVISCSPLMNGTLINIPLPSQEMKCNYNGAKHLQFIRSIPAPSLVCTLVGQKKNRHVKSNLQVLSVPKLTKEEFINFLTPSVRQPIFEKPK